MRTNVLAVSLVALIVGAAIGAFIYKTYQESVKPPVAKGPCSSDQNDHCIDVYVDTVAGKAQIRTIGDENVKARGVIFWIIRTNGYTFSANGVDFVNTTDPTHPDPTKLQHVAPAGEFINCQVMPSQPTIYRCNDTYQHYNPPTMYGYKITVDNPAGTPAASLDPYIVNG